MKGSCHCGAITYEVQEQAFDADYCYCRDCQQTTGAPVATWMDYKVGQVEWTCGEVKEYASSEKIRRGFCSECGSTMTYRHLDHPNYITLSIMSLDNPNSVQPHYHIYTSSKVAWLCVEDNLPKYSRSR